MSQWTIILISGDGDFAYTFTQLRNRGCNLVLIGPMQSSNLLKSMAITYLNWESDIVKMRPRARSRSPSITREEPLPPPPINPTQALLLDRPHSTDDDESTSDEQGSRNSIKITIAEPKRGGYARNNNRGGGRRSPPRRASPPRSRRFTPIPERREEINNWIPVRGRPRSRSPPRRPRSRSPPRRPRSRSPPVRQLEERLTDS